VKKLSGKVVVITGASSGIGRRAALDFAARGAKVVIGARRRNALYEVAREYPDLIEPVVVDTTQQDDVIRLRDRAVEKHGRIDVWINNAAVVVFATLEDAPVEDIRRAFETNVFGYIYGMKATMEQFRAQGHGVLINNASVLGRVAIPYVTVYNSTKFAIRGITESLRQEALDNRDIHICLVEPGPVDTPIWQVGANYTGKRAQPLKPMVTAEDVAEAFIEVALDPEDERVVGVSGTLQVAARRLLPRFGTDPMKGYVEKNLFLDEPAPATQGNLFEPAEPTSESGGWKSDPSMFERAMKLAGLLLSASALRRLIRSR
jgi:short-subunit dehydrogenase